MSLEQEITNWIKFAKGDYQGHPFHGNQWTSASALVEKANKLLERYNRSASVGRGSEASIEGWAKQHTEAAASHLTRAGLMREAGNTRAANLHAKAAEAHQQAARHLSEMASTVKDAWKHGGNVPFFSVSKDDLEAKLATAYDSASTALRYAQKANNAEENTSNL